MNPINNSTDSLLSKILVPGGNSDFYSFSNADGKQWMMPSRHMGTAMHLYQPSGVKGKMVKQLFPYLYWCSIVRRILHAEKIQCQLRRDLNEILLDQFGVKDLEFSVFGGTPCVHQKITIQLSRGHSILGYCKIGNHHEIFPLFEGESKLLTYLHHCGVEHIPRSLFCGKLQDGIGVFLQTTEKTKSSSVVHEWTNLQEDFLTRLYQKTHRKIKFEDSEYYQSLVLLLMHLDWLPILVNRGLIKSITEQILAKYAGLYVDYSAYHADFTPWNMFEEQGHLFVFDFEYAKVSYPPFLDRYHFFLQTAIFERHWDLEKIITYSKSAEGRWVNHEQFVLYLLEVISRFNLREQGLLDEKTTSSFLLWSKLLEYFSL